MEDLHQSVEFIWYIKSIMMQITSRMQKVLQAYFFALHLFRPRYSEEHEMSDVNQVDSLWVSPDVAGTDEKVVTVSEGEKLEDLLLACLTCLTPTRSGWNIWYLLTLSN